MSDRDKKRFNLEEPVHEKAQLISFKQRHTTIIVQPKHVNTVKHKKLPALEIKKEIKQELNQNQ